jgi:hypothetical protein
MFSLYNLIILGICYSDRKLTNSSGDERNIHENVSLYGTLKNKEKGLAYYDKRLNISD